MATILCIETATTNCSVALSVNGSVIALMEDNSKEYSHAERLHVFVEELLEEAKIEKQDLQAIAVSMGPGSYTGLRIGVSAAKGLCFSLDIPLISISTLQSLAHKVEVNISEYIIPLIDARRMEVFSGVFSAKKQLIRDICAEILDENSFAEYLNKGRVTFIGNGVEKFKDVCNHENACYRTHENPSARQMASMAEVKFNETKFEDVAYFEPFYLKDFIAGK